MLSAVVFRLLLIASLWQGPIAWGHAHSPNVAGLADHIAKFHSGQLDTSCCDWHWHYSLIGDALPSSPDRENSQNNPQSEPRTLARVISLESSNPLQVLSYLSFEFAPTQCAAKADMKLHQQSSLKLLQSHCPEHTAQYVFCRILC